MVRYLSLKDFETALQAVDASVEVLQFLSERSAGEALQTPPVGKQIARIDGGMNNIVLIFNATGFAALSSLIFAGVKGGYYAIESSRPFNVPSLNTPVEVRVHVDPAALQAYLRITDIGALVTVFADESKVVGLQANTEIVLSQPGRYVSIRALLSGRFLFIRDYMGHFVTVRS